MTDIDSDELEPEPGDSDRGEDLHVPDGPDMTDDFALGEVPASLLKSALAMVRDVLHSQAAVGDLKTYYDMSSDYAGRTFLDGSEVTAMDFTAADLFAVSLLRVTVRPGAARLLLDSGPKRDELIALLTAIPPNLGLAAAETSTYAAMALLYTNVKATLGTNPWVTASKLCARKRPRLFPIRDKRVRMFLGLYRYGNYTIDWQVFSHVMRQPDVVDRLAELKEDAERERDGRVSLDPNPLRHLDVLLWMEARRQGIGGAVR